MDAVDVIAHCRSLGAVLVPEGDNLKVRSATPLPDYLRELLRANKIQVGLVLKLLKATLPEQLRHLGKKGVEGS